MRAYEDVKEIDPVTGLPDSTVFNDALQLMTERYRVQDVDAPEHYEVGGPIANAIAAGFMQEFASKDRLFFDIPAQAAFGESPGDPEARSALDIFGVTESGEEIRVQDYLQATGWTRAAPTTLAQSAGSGYSSRLVERVCLRVTLLIVVGVLLLIFVVWVQAEQDLMMASTYGWYS